MRRVRALIPGIAVGAAAIVAGCSLIDPLDDLREVPAEAGGADSGAGADVGFPAIDAAASRDAADDACLAEREPNGDDASAGTLPLGSICGTIDGDDVDVYSFAASGDGVLTITLFADEPLTASVKVGPFEPSSRAAGQPNVTSVSGGAAGTVVVTRGAGTSSSVPYRLARDGL